MRKSILAITLAGTAALGACANNPRVAEGAAIGAAGGAVIGAAVGGLAGAVWADRNNDGVVDGYVYNGQYYTGAPAGYTGTTVVTPAPAPMPAPIPSRSGERG